VNNFVLMQIFQTYNNVGNEKFGLRLTEFPFASDMVSQIAAIEVVHNQI
jgi:hypothetical protein